MCCQLDVEAEEQAKRRGMSIEIVNFGPKWVNFQCESETAVIHHHRPPRSFAGCRHTQNWAVNHCVWRSRYAAEPCATRTIEWVGCACGYRGMPAVYLG